MAQEPAGEAEVLRVAIQGGGCGGFEYALGFDRGATGEDAEFEFHGVTVVVDPASAPYLKGATVDFVESLKESGFKIENPNASGSCGCGHSFQVPKTATSTRPRRTAVRLQPLSRRLTDRQLRVAVVGSGPAGFYAAGAAARARGARST